MGMSTAICKNEVERFELVKQNYNGNLPKFIKEVHMNLEIPKGFSYQQLDYGSKGMSLTKRELLNIFEHNLNSKYLMLWQKEYCEEIIEFVKNHEDRTFMLVRYEI
ncbi:gp31 [Bacillus phage G]|uniref:Gp31 n=1 Tax=Bacillus phage G TaxID=2884420 RepID=G3MBA1_9CAUD|nr:gp31 [Bacillus phage G]AEO93302.1 gp31 [Bacillus phage G]